MSQDAMADGFDQWNVAEDDGVLDGSDTLDDDRVADPLDTGWAPTDRWSGANRFGTTPLEQRTGQSLAELLAQEEPDIDPLADGGVDEDDLIRRGYDLEPRSGRLASDDGFIADRAHNSVAWDAGVDGGGASAEEAAMHVVDDPNGIGEGPLI